MIHPAMYENFGAGMFVFPHGHHVDRDGNVWVTDGRGKGAKGHQVHKFSPDGKVLMTLGKAGVTGDGPDTFNSPSDVLVAPNGDIFVADGHGGETNARIVKFSKDGTFIKAWGKKGRAASFCEARCRASTAEDVDQLSCGAPAAQIGGRSCRTVSAGSRKAHALVGAAAKVPSFLRACHAEARVLPQLSFIINVGLAGDYISAYCGRERRIRAQLADAGGIP